jgi:uncharacterized protein YecT (DUF1311 family)
MRGAHRGVIAFARLSMLPALVFLLSSLASAAAKPTPWPLEYRDRSTNAFIWDKRTEPLVRATVPRPLVELVLEGLGGPPGPVDVVQSRYVSASACVPHYCPSKAFYWIDTATGVALGAHYEDGLGDEANTLDLGSRTLGADSIPAPAATALVAWLTEEDLVPARVVFHDGRGHATTLPATRFRAHPAYVPPGGGPSFDCRRAATPVERTICANPVLMEQDLALARLFEESIQGHDTRKSRDELRAFQREWLRTRDAACTASDDAVRCLMDSYDSQHDRLMHWLPSH